MVSGNRLSRRAIVAMAAVVAVAVAVTLALVASDGGAAGSNTTATGNTTAAGPTRRESSGATSPGTTPKRSSSSSAGLAPEGVEVGVDRDEEGAVEAAIGYATAPQAWLYLSDDEVRASVEAMVAPGSEGGLVDEVVYEVGILRDALEDAEGTVWFIMAPLATRVDRYSDDRATVRVWVVGVLSAADVAMPHAGWHTATYDLVWRGDWLVADVTETEGPVPQLEPGQQPWSAGYLDEQLDGFTRVGA